MSAVHVFCCPCFLLSMSSAAVQLSVAPGGLLCLLTAPSHLMKCQSTSGAQEKHSSLTVLDLSFSVFFKMDIVYLPKPICDSNFVLTLSNLSHKSLLKTHFNVDSIASSGRTPRYLVSASLSVHVYLWVPSTSSQLKRTGAVQDDGQGRFVGLHGRTPMGKVPSLAWFQSLIWKGHREEMIVPLNCGVQIHL